MESPRVLSIQSHVVYGYVGNKSATFPLQLLGFDVDPVNSVQFSNHTGYGFFKGQILTENDLDTLMEGLRHNDLQHYTHLLTGYVNSPSFLKRIVQEIHELKKINPNLVYVCDPVMGDNGHMYVPVELLPIYQNEIVSLADILTPNQYEVELLTGIKVEKIEDAWKALEMLHCKGVKTIVLSSTDLKIGNCNKLLALASITKKDGTKQKLSIKIPEFPARFTGTGDLFAALLLAWMYKTSNDLKKSLENTIATMQSVLKKTFEKANSNQSKRSLELCLIQSKNAIENPVVEIFCEEH